MVGDVSEDSSTFVRDRDNGGIVFRGEVGKCSSVDWKHHPRTLDVCVARYLCTGSGCQ